MKKKKIFLWTLLSGLLIVLLGAFLKIQDIEIFGKILLAIGFLIEIFAIIFFLRSIFLK